jgi:Leucine-rich repeat (LRR) protein
MGRSVSISTITSGKDAIAIDVGSIEHSQLPEVHTYYEEHKNHEHVTRRIPKSRVVLYCIVVLFITAGLLGLAATMMKTYHLQGPTSSTSSTTPSNQSKDDVTEDDVGAIQLLTSSPLGAACYFLGYKNLEECLSSTEYDDETVQTSTTAVPTMLFNTIPTEIGLLTHFKKLNFFKNAHLQGTLPTEIGLLTNLEALEMNGLGLSGTIPTTIGRLTLLQLLELHNNHFTGSIPATLESLSNLVEINLSSNKISGSIPSNIFRNWLQIQSVWLQKNHLTGPIPSTIGFMKECEVVFFSNNQLSGSIPISVGNMSSLQVLMVHNNQLTGSIPNELVALKSLWRLYLTNNTAFAGTIPTIKRASILNEMVITNTSITGTIPSALCRQSRGDVHYEIDCYPTSQPKIYCNCCLSSDGNACPNSTLIPDVSNDGE